jgi:uncharacterized damage-inducible protein DinB
VSELQTAIEKLGNAIHSATKFVAELPKEVLFWKPAEDIWSIMEILCHIEEVINYWPDQIKQIIAYPGIEWGRDVTDKARLEAVSRAHQRTLADVLNQIMSATLNTQEMLHFLSDEDLKVEGTSRNPNFGTKPVSFIINHLLIEHIEKHIHQMERNVQKFNDLSTSSK